jgi:hypothetical protein
MHQTFEQELVGFVLIVLFVIIFLWVIFKGVITLNKLDNEREWIKRMPNSLREGRLLIRRKNPDGSYHDLSFDTLSLKSTEPEVKRLPEDKRKQLHWQKRNDRKNGRQMVVYRRSYPSHLRKFYREEDE